jgi:hypothetical protein
VKPGVNPRRAASVPRIGALPSPEVKKLGYFVGKWVAKGMILPGSWGAGGKFRWTETTKWMAGHFFVIGSWDFQMPDELGGDGEEIFLMGYDPNLNAYTFDAFSSQGLHQVSRGTLQGDTWIWISEGTFSGKSAHQKMTMKVLSPTRYTLKFEVSCDAAAWKVFMEGEARKRS